MPMMVLVMLGCCLCAVEPAPSFHERLASEDPQVVAWSAWEAAEAGAPGCGEALCAALARLAPQRDDPMAAHAFDVCVDAAMRLRVVPNRHSLDLVTASGLWEWAFIWAAVDPRAVHDWIVERGKAVSLWSGLPMHGALLNVAASLGSREAVAAIVSEVRPCLYVGVWDPDAEGGRFESRSGGGRKRRVLQHVDGMPPLARHAIYPGRPEGSVLLCDALETFSSLRVLDGMPLPERAADAASKTYDAAYRFRLLIWMIHQVDADEFCEPPTVQRYLKLFSENGSLAMEDIDAARLELRAEWMALAQSLELVDLRPADFPPAMELSLHDCRKNTAIPLPTYHGCLWNAKAPVLLDEAWHEARRLEQQGAVMPSAP